MTPETFGKAFIAHLEGWLRVHEADDAGLDRRRDEARSQGLRIVSGGDTGPWNDPGGWTEYIDDDTGEVLFAGEAAEPNEGWQDNWIHADKLIEGIPMLDNPVDPSLPHPVREFLESLATVCLNLEAAGLRSLLDDITE